MKTRVAVLVAGLLVALAFVVLATGCGPTLLNQMNYQGRLTDAAGNPVTGTRNMTFRLYTAASGGTMVWEESQSSVQVTNGLFNVVLGSTRALPVSEFHQPLYLEVVVAGQTLSPRQLLLGSPYAFSLAPGAVVRGAIPKTATGTYTSTLSAVNLSDGLALVANSLMGIGAYVEGGGATRFDAALRVYNTNPNHGMATYMVNNSDYATAHFDNDGSGQVLWLTNGGTDGAGTGGGDFISAWNKPENDCQFRVRTDGQVRSDIGFETPAMDVAEMLPAVDGLEPGDVLVIGKDGKLTRSTEAYQPTVVGVYSTRPGFVGGQPVEEELEEHVPLAVAGIVPVKVCAENGAIQPGDLLTSSSTPGHAMKATEARPGTILGKALGELATGTGVIDMLIMLR